MLMRLTCACLTKLDSISDHELIPSRLLRVSMFTIKNYAARVLIPMSDVYVCDVFIRSLRIKHVGHDARSFERPCASLPALLAPARPSRKPPCTPFS